MSAPTGSDDMPAAAAAAAATGSDGATDSSHDGRIPGGATPIKAPAASHSAAPPHSGNEQAHLQSPDGRRVSFCLSPVLPSVIYVTSLFRYLYLSFSSFLVLSHSFAA
eukprot:GHVU01169543.1.p5 GENE.GHVU01169543.1~~GHVU01169543.1.p5  ORF type:complete len:108 (+),score=13.35 GHVU01169543.1:142-465(+)